MALGITLQPPQGKPAQARTGEAEILFVTRKWAPAMGGMETYCLRLVEAVGTSEAIDVIALPGRANGLPPGRLALLAFPFAVLGHYFKRRRAPRILHIADMALWPVGLLFWFTGRSARVVLSAHGTDIAYQRRGGFKGGLYGAYLKLGARLLRKAKVIANSCATRDVLAETGWRNVAIIPLATDLDTGSLADAHNGKLLFAGRLVERKGCAWFIREVLPLLEAESILQVAGTIWDEDERSALQHPQVEFLGNLDQQALACAYREAQCVVVPNIEHSGGEYEGFGLVAAEAAAAGGIVLASDHGGLRDAVIDGETGMLVKTGDAIAWRDAIAHVAAWSGDERSKYLARSTETARSYYCWDRVARDTLAAYPAVAKP